MDVDQYGDATWLALVLDGLGRDPDVEEEAILQWHARWLNTSFKRRLLDVCYNGGSWEAW